jgi:hypothetical protein
MPGEVLELPRTRNAVQKRTPAPHPPSKSKAMKLLFLIYHPPFVSICRRHGRSDAPIIVTIWTDDIVAGAPFLDLISFFMRKENYSLSFV